MPRVGFAVRAEYEGVVGASSVYGDDRNTINITEALEAGGGKIVTDDPLLIGALDTHLAADGPLLERVEVAESDETYAQPGRTSAGSLVEAQQGEVTDEDAAEHSGPAAEIKADSDYEHLTVPDLRQIAMERDLGVKSSATKDELVQALEADDDKAGE